MIEYFAKYYAKLFLALGEHIHLLFLTLLQGVFLSLILGFLIYRLPMLSGPVMTVLKVLYTIPSLAFFALLIPLSGIGTTTAIIVLTAYSLFFLVSSFLNGLSEIDPDVVEAGKAMGYSSFQLFRKVELPLCLPSILNGIRLAAISTIGIGCVAYAIGAGGLGSILFEGMRQSSYEKILWGSIFVVVLNITVNVVLSKVQSYFTKRMHLED